MAHASVVATPNDEQTVQQLSIMTALHRTFLGRRVRDIVGKHYERLQRFGFKSLKSGQYYAPSELDAAFDAPVTSPTVAALPPVEQAKQPEPARECRTFKWKGLPHLDEADLDRDADEAPGTLGMLEAIDGLSNAFKKLTKAAKVADLTDDQAVAVIEALVGGALQLAALSGRVLTVETRPNTTLAMGSYKTVVDIRESNKVYRERYRREAEAKEAIRKPSAGPVVLGHPLPEQPRVEHEVIAGDFGTYEHPYQPFHHPV